jgi:zinc protease
MKLLYRRAPAFPLTQVVLIFPRTGVCLDPPERQGLTRLTSRMLFCGAGGLSHHEFNSRLERLGATTGSTLANDHFAPRLIALTQNLEPALELFLAAILRPNLEAGEFRRLREELHSTWISDREEQKNLRAQDVYLKRIYGGQPTGYQADGTEAGLLEASIEDVRCHYPRLFGHEEPILGVLTNLERAEAERRIAPRFAALAASPNGIPYPWDAFQARRPQGRQVTIITDPLTQTDELIAGVFTTGENDPDWHIHRLIALIFGGDMNSRLFRVIRGERGYSYGASCWYESSQGRAPRNQVSPFTMYTFPTVEHTEEALPMFVSLYEELVERGVEEDELARAKEALIHSHAFLRDTPQKLLSLDCDEALYGIPTDDEKTNRAKIAAVTREDVLRVLRRSHHPESLTLILLGDPKRLEPAARRIPGLAGLELIEYPPRRSAA